ncbi:antitoxin protein (plasmid) [Sinorhizobium fredii]|uniref:Antitoxin protein n=1 Tax=Rhizobium fredii TaxID=380 RepID=A0A2L0HCT6_RHIFR|nr:antitoxin protein [Sinorhizobium fredii]
MKEAIERRRKTETPRQTAARLREKYGVKLAPRQKSRSRVRLSTNCWKADVRRCHASSSRSSPTSRRRSASPMPSDCEGRVHVASRGA